MLNDQVALVTGGSRGIGRAAALALAGAGAKVAVNYQSSRAKAQAVCAEIEAMGREAVCLGADVAKSDEVDEMVKEVLTRFGRLDILINNAGVVRDSLLIRMKDEDWDQVLDTNLKGAFNCLRACARPMMKQRAGRIVNVSSVVGLTGNPGQLNYAASKAGLVGLTKSAAKELASRGILVNAVAPGYIETDMTDSLDSRAREALAENIPVKRIGNPKDVANLILFLAGSESAYITGQVIAVDGGLAM
ncbi:MAG: 3-oxoacyl-[acyl-carrier-protein] reductase [Peptococcaceae bacterium]|jgi:3-oxoacyl-[acyl-carrier protein] reductase|nr:3-oxoacyl-[acyl-carrier-protein] reductase [Peptococcaceae bacterium]